MRSIRAAVKVCAALATVLALTLITVGPADAKIRLGQKGLGQGKRFRDRTDAEDLPRQRPNAARRMNNALGGGMQMRLWARVLKLNDEQIKRMRQIQRRSAPEYLSLEAQIREKRQSLERAIYNENFNAEETKQLAGELARLEGQRVLMKTRIQAEMRLVLTPEQIRIFKELRFGEANSELSPDITPEDLNELKEEPKN